MKRQIDRNRLLGAVAVVALVFAGLHFGLFEPFRYREKELLVKQLRFDSYRCWCGTCRLGIEAEIERLTKELERKNLTRWWATVLLGEINHKVVSATSEQALEKSNHDP